MTHYCRVCGDELDDDNWYQGKQKKRDYICKECSKEKTRLYRAVNRDEMNAKQRLYREENRDKINAQARARNEANRCIINAQKRLYREENRDKINERDRLYRAVNRDEMNAKQRARHKANPDKAKANGTRASRKKGCLSMSENKECTLYLGVYRVERLLKHFFNDVEMMPFGNKGYDAICNKGKKVDAKSSCIQKNGNGWTFHIKHNTIADYFWCVALDNRKNLTIIHIWMLPGDKFSHLSGVSISPSTIDKWSEYEKSIDEAIICWNEFEESG